MVGASTVLQRTGRVYPAGHILSAPGICRLYHRFLHLYLHLQPAAVPGPGTAHNYETSQQNTPIRSAKQAKYGLVFGN